MVKFSFTTTNILTSIYSVQARCTRMCALDFSMWLVNIWNVFECCSQHVKLCIWFIASELNQHMLHSLWQVLKLKFGYLDVCTKLGATIVWVSQSNSYTCKTSERTTSETETCQSNYLQIQQTISEKLWAHSKILEWANFSQVCLFV